MLLSYHTIVEAKLFPITLYWKTISSKIKRTSCFYGDKNGLYGRLQSRPKCLGHNKHTIPVAQCWSGDQAMGANIEWRQGLRRLPVADSQRVRTSPRRYYKLVLRDKT